MFVNVFIVLLWYDFHMNSASNCLYLFPQNLEKHSSSLQEHHNSKLHLVMLISFVKKGIAIKN
jgi:hypothetical protein